MLPLHQQDVSQRRVKVLGIDITELSNTSQIIVLSLAVFIFYIGYGYLQELLFKPEGMKPLGWYLTFIQFGLYSLFAYIQNSDIKHRRIPMKIYFQLAFYTVATMGFSNASVGYLNYPTQVIFKCCKLIPVLIGGIIIQKKRYGLLDFVSAFLMCIGLILFSLADSQVSPNFNSKGYIMISLALVADAIIGNVQEKFMKQHNASNNEVVFFSYSIGCSYIFIITLITGEFFDGFNYFYKNPIETYGYSILFSILGFCGVNIVLTLVRTTGAFTTVTITTMRKAVTIILSFLLFSKPFTIAYFWAGLIVIFGIYLNVYNKNKTKWNQHLISIIKKSNLYIPIIKKVSNI